MKLFKWGLLPALSMVLFACSDSSSSSDSGANPPDTEIELSSCQAIDDENLNARVVQANAQVFDAFNAIDKSDFESLQAEIDSAKSIFEEALSQYPNSCAAQFGLGVTLLGNVVNDPLVDSVYKAYSTSETEVFHLFNMDIEGYFNAALQMSLKNEKGLFHDRAQTAIAERLLSKTDSATALFQNVLRVGNFSYKAENFTLDQGDLNIALGTVQVLNGLLTAVASLNLDASKDDSYNWYLNLYGVQKKYAFVDTLSPQEIAALTHATNLLKKNSPFLTVKSAWKASYSAIPETLDSAVENVKKGLLFKIATADQNPNAIFVVGYGEYADVSPDDLQKAIDVFDSIQQGLRGTISLELYGEEVAINAKKFFQITDGIQDFLPYFRFTDPSTWLDLPDVERGWTENCYFAALQDSVFIGQYEMMKQFKTIYPENFEYLDFYYYDYGFNGDNLYLAIGYETEDDWNSVKVYFDGCDYRFETDEQAGTDSTQKFTLSDENCRMENGKAYYRTISDNFLDTDVLRFTDATGKETVSLMEIHAMPSEEKTAAFYAQNIIFPDPTFGGVFPQMTQEQIGRILHYWFEEN